MRWVWTYLDVDAHAPFKVACGLMRVPVRVGLQDAVLRWTGMPWPEGTPKPPRNDKRRMEHPTRMQFQIPEALHAMFYAACKDRGCSGKAAVADAVRQWVDWMLPRIGAVQRGEIPAFERPPELRDPIEVEAQLHADKRKFQMRGPPTEKRKQKTPRWPYWVKHSKQWWGRKI